MDKEFPSSMPKNRKKHFIKSINIFFDNFAIMYKQSFCIVSGLHNYINTLK